MNNRKLKPSECVPGRWYECERYGTVLCYGTDDPAERVPAFVARESDGKRSLKFLTDIFQSSDMTECEPPEWARKAGAGEQCCWVDDRPPTVDEVPDGVWTICSVRDGTTDTCVGGFVRKDWGAEIKSWFKVPPYTPRQPGPAGEPSGDPEVDRIVELVKQRMLDEAFLKAFAAAFANTEMPSTIVGGSSAVANDGA